MPVLGVELGAPHGSPPLDAPSPNGSLVGEEAGGGLAEPHASSVLAEAGAPHGSSSGFDVSPNGSELSTGEEALFSPPQGSPSLVSWGADVVPQGSAPVGGEVAGAPHASVLPEGGLVGGALKGSEASSFGGLDAAKN